MADAVTVVGDDDVVETGGDADDGAAASSEPLRWTFDGGGRAGELLSRSRPAALPAEEVEEGVDVASVADEEEVAIS